MTSTSKAIVLSREHFGEADSYVQFFTEEWGLITALAKSARKSRRRYAGGLDLFCHDEISVRGNPRDRTAYLEELRVLNSFLGLRDELERTLAAGRMLSWIRQLTDGAGSMPEVYRLLGQSLALLEKESSPGKTRLLELVFKMKLLHLLGFKPRTHCPRGEDCRAKEVFLDFGTGGVACYQCAENKTVSRHFLLNPAKQRFLSLAESVRFSSWGEVNMETELGVEAVTHLNQLVTQFAAYHSHQYLP